MAMKNRSSQPNGVENGLNMPQSVPNIKINHLKHILELYKRSYSFYKMTFWLVKIAKKYEKFVFLKCFYLVERHLWNSFYSVSGPGKCFWLVSQAQKQFSPNIVVKNTKTPSICACYYQMLWTADENFDFWWNSVFTNYRFDHVLRFSDIIRHL